MKKEYKYVHRYCLYYLISSPFIPSRNLDEVLLTYNHMALMSLRSRSHVKVSAVL